MSQVVRTALAHLLDEEAATAVEYALMIALIALAIFGAVSALGISVTGWFNDPDLGNALS